MGIGTLLRYLIGSRQAILEIASDRRALGLGFLFVVSAGFAREYDGKDLLHEPWHLAVPLVVSLVASFLLFLLTYTVAQKKGALGPRFFTAYRMFLGLFWLTAPLAWLYAIPYERFLTPYGATLANLLTLASVALWRVALMVRVVSVLMGFSAWSAMFLVMALADAEALLALKFAPIPILELMGGIQLSQAESLRLKAAFLVGITAGLALVPWIIGAVVTAIHSKPSWQGPHAVERSRWLGSARVLAWCSLAFWLLLLPHTQPEQILRSRVERNLAQGRLTEALADMSTHAQEDFPRYWDPPPRPRYGEDSPPILDVLEAIVDHWPAPWVRELYQEKITDYISGRRLSDSDLPRILTLWKRWPEMRPAFDEGMRRQVFGNFDHLFIIPPLERMQGRWKITSIEQGTEHKQDETLGELRVSENQFDIRSASLMATGTLTVPSDSEIDFLVPSGADRGKTLKGIYVFQWGNWTISFGPPGKERPAEFRPPKRPDVTTLVLHRVGV
jgi:uncharacterized protein (TIGR03067 family)